MKFIITCAVILYGALLLSGNANSPVNESIYAFASPENNRPIALVGDLQRTSIWELVMGREQNDPEREQIIKSISDENPAMLVLLGDMVFDGSSEFQWDYFDSLLTPVKNKNIPLYPVIGNHEYWGKKSSNLRLLNKRFPFLREKSWYVQTHDSLALIFLNSNQTEMSAAQWDEQKNWFNNRIYNFEHDTGIKGILVFTHHPPYTNSTITGDEIHVQKAFLPAFTRSSKTVAFISGHAHTYERFRIDDKMFIISGGGGGPRVPLKIGRDCHDDLCKDDSPKRPFNYLLVNRLPQGVNITVKALKKDETRFFILEEFTLPFNMHYTISTN